MTYQQGASSMASVFVSHSSRDRAVTDRVVQRLRAAGLAALFLDFDPEQGIPAGRSWERELYVQLRKTDAVIFLASAAATASRWCAKAGVEGKPHPAPAVACEGGALAAVSSGPCVVPALGRSQQR